MADERGKQAERDQADMASERAPFESTWRDVTYYAFPRSRDVTERSTTPARLTQPELADTTAGAALMRAAAFLEHATTPRGQRWHGLRMIREDLDKITTARRWLDRVRDGLFSRREAPGTRWAVEKYEHDLGLAGFGTACLRVLDGGPRGWRYKAIPLAELYIAENGDGEVDKVHRRYDLTGRQLLHVFEADLPAKTRTQAEREPQRKWTVVHRVLPRLEADPNRRDWQGKPWASIYVLEDGWETIREHGFDSRPYFVTRLWPAPGEVYGRGLAAAALPTIRGLNSMKRSLRNQANRAAEPVLLGTDDDLPAPRLTPNAVNFGWVSPEGKPLLLPLHTGQRFDVGLELLDAEKRVIGDHMLTNLFEIMVDRPQMTATEVLERASEKGIVLSPIVGQEQDELLGPMVEREVQFYEASADLPDPPGVLQGQAWAVSYDTPITRALKAAGGKALLTWINALAPLGQVLPDALKVIRPVEAARILAESLGVPAEAIASDEEIEAEGRAEEETLTLQAIAERATQAAAAAGPGSPL